MPHAEKYLLAGVMGFPIMHSRSPAIHNYWLAEYGMLGHYAPLAVKPDGLEKALRALHPLGFAGVNLTIPLHEPAPPSPDAGDHGGPPPRAVTSALVGRAGNVAGLNANACGFA